MATITINSVPASVIEAEAVPVENILQITTPDQSPSQSRLYTIVVKVGTYQFAVGKALAAENPAYTVAGELKLTLSQLHKLRFLATTQNDRFDITR